MITGENIALLIKNPVKTTGADLSAIEDLISKYPYCSSLYHLALKGASNSGVVQFEEKLKVAAAHVGDREHLYNLIHNTSVKQEIVEQTEIEVEFVKEEIKGSVSEPSESDHDLVELSSSTEKIKEELVSTDISDSVEVEKASEIEEAPVDLDTDILSHAISVAFEHATETAIPEKKEEPEEIEDKEKIQPISNTLIGQQESEDKTTVVEEIQEISENQEISFIQWLQQKKSGNKTVDKQLNSSTPPDLNLEIKASSKSEINDLLDRFIAEEPSISKPTKEFYSPSANAKKSLEESDEIVSETLAKIHVMQGNFSKAIAAYKQLSLLYPEKKVFFASQIEKIKNNQSQ